jgi:hypothetical protein
MMRSFLVSLIVLSCCAVPGWAQQPADAPGGKTLGGKASSDMTPTGMTLGGKSDSAASETCVEVEIGGERSSSLDCLNRQLKHVVDRVQPIGNIPPISASSPAVQVGGFNEAAMSQQFGPNLGKSVFPYRPPAPVFGVQVR